MARRIGWVLGVILLLAASAHAGGYTFQADVGMDKMDGYTQYEIGGKVSSPQDGTATIHFPISRLEFPLDIMLVSGYGAVKIVPSFAGRDSLEIGLGVKANPSRDAGTVEDSDWGYWWLAGKSWASQDTLDIYSTSQGKVDALLVNFTARYTHGLQKKALRFHLHDAAFLFGLDVRYQHFDYDVGNLDQWYPSYQQYRTAIQNDPTISPELKNTVKGHVYYSGTALEYTVEYLIPLVQAGLRMEFIPGLAVEGILGFAPQVWAQDRDDHLLRDKVSEGDCDGTATMASLKGTYQITQSINLGLRYDVVDIKTRGHQNQYATDYTAVVDQHIESRQETLGLNLGVRF